MQFTEEICDNVEMKKQLVLGDVPLRFRILCIVDLNDFLLWSAEIWRYTSSIVQHTELSKDLHLCQNGRVTQAVLN